MEKNTNKVSIVSKIKLLIAIFGVIFPAITYLIGVAFYEGGFSAYGIRSEVFPISIQDIYVQAYFAMVLILRDLNTSIINIFTQPNWYTLIIAPLIFMYLFLVLLRKIEEGKGKEEKEEKYVKLKKLVLFLHWKNNDFTKAVGAVFLSLSGLAFASHLFLIFSVSLLVFPTLAYNKSVDLADKNRSDFIVNKCHIKEGELWNNCRVLKNESGKVIYEGILVAENKDYIAFFTKEGAVVAPRPKGAVVVHYFKVNINKSVEKSPKKEG